MKPQPHNPTTKKPKKIKPLSDHGIVRDKSQSISQRQTPLDLKPHDNNKWIKFFNFSKVIDIDLKRKKQRSADLIYLNPNKTETYNREDRCPSMLSQYNRKKKPKKQLEGKGKKVQKKVVKTKKNLVKKKTSINMFRESKLASIKSVDVSLVDSTQEQFHELNITSTLHQIEIQPFYSQEIQRYEQLYHPQSIHECSQLGQTQNLIQKYIDLTESEVDEPQPPKMTVNAHQDTMLLQKVQEMLWKLEHLSQDESNVTSASQSIDNEFKEVNVKDFEIMLGDRMATLKLQRNNQLARLEDRFEEGIIKEDQFLKERKRINKWVCYELQNTEKVKKNLKSGVKEALALISKAQSIDWPQIIKKQSISQSRSSSVLKLATPKRPKQKVQQPINQQQPTNGVYFNLKQVEIEQPKHSKEQIEDVFQYIFIDLCLQMAEEQLLIKKMLLKKPKPKRKGFDCGKKYVMSFVKDFSLFVEKSREMAEGMLSTLRKPIGPTPFDMLRYMREDNQDLEEFESYDKGEQTTYVFSFSWFEKFSKQYILAYEFQPYFSDSQKEQKRLNFLRHALHFHNKAIFDCMNENIDKHRPYGLFGIPFPWKNRPNLVHEYTNPFIELIMRKVVMEINDCCVYLCGLMLDKESHQLFNYSLSEREIMDLREDRMSRLLCADLNENEPRWLFHDDEETEILVDVSKFILQVMLGELAYELSSMYLI